MLFIAPVILYFGLSNGAFNGIWVGNLVGGGVGAKYVGFVGAVYATSTTLTTMAWGRCIPHPSVGRRTAFASAVAIHVVFWVGSAVWASNVASQPPVLLERSLTFVFFGAVFMGAGDAAFYAQLPATLQTFYFEGADAMCANAAIRVYTSIGFAVMSSVSASLNGAYIMGQMLALAVCALVAGLFLWYLHTRVCSLEGGPPRPPAKPVQTTEEEEEEVAASK